MWSTPNTASPPIRHHTAAGTTSPLSADEDETLEATENQLMYVVLGTVLGVVVLIVVVCIAMCTWRHQQQPRRAVGTILNSFTYFISLFLFFFYLLPSFPLLFKGFFR